jgi:outer membrane protein TolC
MSLWRLALIFLCAAAELQAQPRPLDLGTAISAALENNASIEIAEESALAASARADEQRAALLPNVQARASYVDQVINIGDRGIRFPGIPSRVGPFGTTDVQIQFAEPVLD